MAGNYSAVQRARMIQADLKADCAEIRRELQRAVLTPDQGRYPHRQRNALTDQAMLQLEQKMLEIHRLEKLVPEFSTDDVAGHIALDRYTGQALRSTAGEAYNQAKANRMARELCAPTHPFDRNYEPDPVFEQSFSKVRKDVENVLELQEAQGRQASGRKDQQELAVQAWSEHELASDLAGGRWDSDDAYKNRQAIELMLGGNGPKGVRSVDADPDYDGRTTGDAELDALLREQLPKNSGESAE